MSDLKTQILNYVDQVGAKDAAKAFGVAPSVIQRWKKGTHSPNIGHAEKFMALQGAKPPVHPQNVPVVTMEPLDVESNAPILTKRAVRTVAVSRPATPAGLAAPLPGDILTDDTISTKLPPNIAAANMSVNPFGGNETPIVGPPKKGAPVAEVEEVRPGVRPLGLPKNVITEAQYKAQMDRAHKTPDDVRIMQQAEKRAVPVIDLAPPAPAPVFNVEPQAPIAPRGGYTLEQLQQMRDIFFPWQGKELTLLMPIYKTLNAGTHFASLALVRDLGDKMGYFQESGDAIVANARNKLAKHFLESGSVWSLWLDDDIIPPIGRAGWFKTIGNLPTDFSDKIAGQHVVTRLMSHRRTIVGGTYFSRASVGRPMSYEGQVVHADHMAARNMEDGIRPATWVGTGCLLVHRQVYLDIMKSQPELAPEGGRAEWDFFRLGKNFGEDVAFCQRALAAGHQPFVDTGLQCGHVGQNMWGAWNTNGGTVI